MHKDFRRSKFVFSAFAVQFSSVCACCLLSNVKTFQYLFLFSDKLRSSRLTTDLMACTRLSGFGVWVGENSVVYGGHRA